MAKPASLTAGLLVRKGQAAPSASIQTLYPKSSLLERLFKDNKRGQKRSASVAKHAPGTKDRVRKHLSLPRETSDQLRLLAARTGTSQQHIMAEAVTALLEEALENADCICGAARR